MQTSIKTRGNLCTELGLPVDYRELIHDQLAVRAQLFEGLLVLNPRLNLTWVFFFCSKHFLGSFSLLFLRASNHQLVDKRIKLNLLLKLSYLNSNFALTLGYLNPALNNPDPGGTWTWGLRISILRSNVTVRCLLRIHFIYGLSPMRYLV